MEARLTVSNSPQLEEGSLDLQAKKALLRTFPYGLFALTTACGDEINVFTATWVSQCSFEPPLIMAAVRRDSYSHDLIRNGRVFALNLVRKADQPILQRFFKTVQRVGNKLGDVPFHFGLTGAPILDQAVGTLECTVEGFLEVGDHSVVIGKIVAAYRFTEEEPLICSDTSWHYAG